MTDNILSSKVLNRKQTHLSRNLRILQQMLGDVCVPPLALFPHNHWIGDNFGFSFFISFPIRSSYREIADHWGWATLATEFAALSLVCRILSTNRWHTPSFVIRFYNTFKHPPCSTNGLFELLSLSLGSHDFFLNCTSNNYPCSQNISPPPKVNLHGFSAQVFIDI